jgi:hypothetical protein
MPIPERQTRSNPDASSEAQKKSHLALAAQIASRILDRSSHIATSVLGSRAIPVAVGVITLGLCVELSGGNIEGVVVGIPTGAFNALMTRGIQLGPY